MPESTDTTTATETAAEATTDEAAATDATTETTAPKDAKPEGAEALGDAGKKALDAMKAKWKAAEEKAKAADAAAAALQAKIDGKEAEFAETQKAREAEQAALAKADQKILKAEIRAAAAGKLSHADDALRHPEIIDLSAFEVGADGEVDADAIAQAIDSLLAARPDLAAQSGGRFQGSGDQGARNDANKVSQLSQRDMDGMSPEQIDEAHKAGRFDNLMGVVK